MPSPWRAAASASVTFTRSAPEWPPVIPAITSGRASVWLRSRAERSIRAASVAGSASWTRCTSSHPGARLVSMSSSAAMRRCSALRRSIAAASGDGLLEDTIALECAPFLEREAEDLPEHVIVVRPDRRAGTLLDARGRRQPERGCHQVHLSDRRVVHRRPHRPMGELGVTEKLRDRQHRRGSEPFPTKDRHDLVAVAHRGPGADPLVQLRARSEHGDRAVADGDVVDVRPVEKYRGRVRLAEQLDESGEGAQLAAVSRMEGVRSGLALVAAREDDEPGVIRAELLSSEAKARDGAGGEALDEHVGSADERSRERRALRMLQIERRASLTVVVEGEHPRTIGLDDAVLERRVCRAEDVGGKAALEADDLRAEIREVFADERPGRCATT